MLRKIGVAIALQILLSAAAWACDGQVGKVVFDDTFADDSGGWELTPPQATIKPPDFVLALDSKYINMSSQNITFRATEGDFCLEAVLPPSIAPDNAIYVGLEFWGKDYQNYMLIQLSSTGKLSLYRKASGNWSTVYEVENAPGFKADPDAVNAIRVAVKDGRITSFLNGSQIKVTRAQTPEGELRFGLYGQYDKVVDSIPVLRVKSYKVTTGQ
jgi:hypothetical protein